jgi:hypothetical protein
LDRSSQNVSLREALRQRPDLDQSCADALHSIHALPFFTSHQIWDLSVAWILFAATMGTVGILSTGLWAYVTDEHRLVDPHVDQALVKLILRRDVSPPIVFFVSIFVSMLSLTAAELFTLGMIPVLHNLINRRYHNRTGRKLSWSRSRRRHSRCASLYQPHTDTRCTARSRCNGA